MYHQHNKKRLLHKNISQSRSPSRPHQSVCTWCYVFLGWIELVRDLLSKSHKLYRGYFLANVRMVFQTKPILTSIQKDDLPPHHNNSLIYLFSCSCGSCYIGRTNQRLDARIKQHVPMKIHNFIGGPTDKS